MPCDALSLCLSVLCMNRDHGLEHIMERMVAGGVEEHVISAWPMSTAVAHVHVPSCFTM